MPWSDIEKALKLNQLLENESSDESDSEASQEDSAEKKVQPKEIEVQLTFPAFMQELMAALLEGQKEGRQEGEEVNRCPGCGSSYQDIQKTGKAGCALCYQTFAKELNPLINKIQADDKHIGKRLDISISSENDEIKQASQEDQSPNQEQTTSPKNNTNRLEQAIQEARQQLNEAVASENFEKAAQLRDHIKELNKETGDLS